jgi:DNA-binding beta-propeller fold protein YncE
MVHEAATPSGPSGLGFVAVGSGNGQFNRPYGVAVDGGGHVYVADTGNNRVQVFTTDGAYLTQWGTYGSGDGQFSAPFGVAVDGGGRVYVTDTDNSRVQVFGPLGPTPTKAGSWGRIKALYR